MRNNYDFSFRDFIRRIIPALTRTTIGKKELNTIIRIKKPDGVCPTA
jgi:hypothetical protein